MDGFAIILGLLAGAVCLGLIYGGLKMLKSKSANSSVRIMEGLLGVVAIGAGVVAGLVVLFCMMWVNSPS